ncbi:MAG: HEAT repeat domain-containing protein [Candidatus Eisenbacteria bacterium]
MADDSFVPLRSFDAFSPRGLAGKREYVLDLEKRGDAESCALLVACLADESGYLRDLAEASLVRLKTEPAPVLPLLAAGLWYTKVSAARTLGRLGARAAGPGLATLLDDPNESVRRAGAEALAQLARGEGALAVARALHRRREVDRARALHDIVAGDRALEARLEGLMKDRDAMEAADDELLSHDADIVRASADGVEWGLLTGPRSGREDR